MSPEEAVSGLEFRATDDDAWYSVRLALDGDRLIVNYVSFSDCHDEHFLAGDFKSSMELDEFQWRFRPCSVQLQDRDCRKAIEGLMVCGCCLFPEDNSVLFYDACIEDVQYKEHHFDDAEEECLCTFLLFWQHGPQAGEKTPCGIADICLIRPTIQMDPTLASFLRIARKKIEVARLILSSSSENGAPLCNGNTCSIDIVIPTVEHESCFSQCKLKETNIVRQSGTAAQESEAGIRDCCETIAKDRGVDASVNIIQQRDCCERIVKDGGGNASPNIIQERDCCERIMNGRGENASLNIIQESGCCELIVNDREGDAYLSIIQETSNHYVILIENLETDLSPSTIVEFMNKWISISPQAYIFPSFSSDSFTKGIIVLDSREELETICSFINNPSHIIASSRGRPWVTTGMKLKIECLKIIVESLMLSSVSKPQGRNVENLDQLKLVKAGTEKYKVAKQLKDLYVDFTHHLRKLHKKLALDEGKILQLSTV
ncbi:uncharacterized protein LOC131148496 [Malania oleifera]|uniref:uncharacterized protein LOC131148496 n=1 Tax=Malania oleifera TaxID=397392 RepID=UPI0025AEA6A1|nr:uncharacterized protein LOC131148496 [Malania oleifera]